MEVTHRLRTQPGVESRAVELLRLQAGQLQVRGWQEVEAYVGLVPLLGARTQGDADPSSQAGKKVPTGLAHPRDRQAGSRAAPYQRGEFFRNLVTGVRVHRRRLPSTNVAAPYPPSLRL